MALVPVADAEPARALAAPDGEALVPLLRDAEDVWKSVRV